MTTDNDRMHEFDRAARALHAQAVAQVPARTLRQLRARRAPAPERAHPMRAFGWAAAAACAAVFAVAIGLRQEPVAPGSTEPPTVAADVPAAASDDAVAGDDAYADALASLDEDPGLYLWLASSDVQPLALE